MEPGHATPVARPLFQSDDEDSSSQTGGAGGGGGDGGWRVEDGGNVFLMSEVSLNGSGNVSHDNASHAASHDSGVPHGFAKNADGIPEMQV